MYESDLIKNVNLVSESSYINSLVDEVISNHASLRTDEILSDVKLYSDKLPDLLRRNLYSFKNSEDYYALIIKLDLSNYYIGSTPTAIPDSDAKKVMSKIEILHAVISSYLGEIFTWNSIQNGNIFNEIIPIKENIEKPISSGTSTFFDLHTEDGFHPLMGDYLSLFCLRNPNIANTVLSYVGEDDIADNIKAILFQDRFFVGANIAHEMDHKPTYMPILFGNWEKPYLRINLNNVRVDEHDEEAKLALQTITNVLKKNMVYYSLTTGDLLIIDNLRMVHGRDIYNALYDGNDRWLKRLYLTNDLRKSRHLRSQSNSRTITLI